MQSDFIRRGSGLNVRIMTRRMYIHRLFLLKKRKNFVGIYDKLWKSFCIANNANVALSRVSFASRHLNRSHTLLKSVFHLLT